MLVIIIMALSPGVAISLCNHQRQVSKFTPITNGNCTTRES